MWTPLGETYLVRPDEVKVSHLIPEHLKMNMVDTRTGIVVTAGTTLLENGTRIPLQAQPGDRIKFGAKVGHELEIGGEKLLLIADANALAIESPDNEVLGRSA